MSSLIDTTIIVDYLRNNSKAVAFIEQEVLSNQIIFASVISYAEIYAGIRPKEEESISLFFSGIRIIGIGTKIAEYAGRYLKDYGKSHGLELADAFIAATAFITGSRLVTLNRKHFPMTDINIYVPY
jgi:hypothetical protein